MKQRIFMMCLLLLSGVIMVPSLMAETLKVAGNDFNPDVSFEDTQFPGMTSGTISYNATNRRLTFKNVVIPGSGSSLGVYFSGDHITLRFEGKNVLTGGSHGIRINTSNYCNIESAYNMSYVEVSTARKPDSNGSVYHALWFSGNGRVSINNIYLKATAYSQAITGNGSCKLEVDFAWVDAKSTNGNAAINKFVSAAIGDELYLERGNYDTSKKYFVEGSTTLSEVKVLPKLTVGGEIVNTESSEASEGWLVEPVGQTAGSIKYVNESQKLVFEQVTGTFGNVNLPEPYGQYLVYNAKIDNLNVAVKGTNTIQMNSNLTYSYGIWSDKTFTVIGGSNDYSKDVFKFTGDYGFTSSENAYQMVFKKLTVNVSGESPICSATRLSINESAVTATAKNDNEEALSAQEFAVYGCDISGGYFDNGHFYGKDGNALKKAVIKTTNSTYAMSILGRNLNDVNIADFAAPGWKSGTLLYNNSTQRLTLTDVQIDATKTNTNAYGIDFDKTELYFKGSCSIMTGNKAALNLKSDVTISSDEMAEVMIASDKSVGCQLADNKTLTIKGGNLSEIDFVGSTALKGSASTTLKMVKGNNLTGSTFVSKEEGAPAFTVGKFVNEDGLGFDFHSNGYQAAYWDVDKKMPLCNGGKCAYMVALMSVSKVYRVKICGKAFNDVNSDGMAGPFFTTEGGNQAVFDATNNMLTLTNAHIDKTKSDTDGPAIEMGDFTTGTNSGRATLTINGENHVSGSPSLRTQGNLIITSATKDFKSTLELSAINGVGIELYFNSSQMDRWLDIKDKAYVKISGPARTAGIGCTEIDAPHGVVTINDATIDITSGGIGKIKKLNLADCMYTCPEDGKFDSNQGAVVDSDGNRASKIQIRSINDAVTPHREDVVINEDNFPDEKFRNFLLYQDYGKDGFLTDAELLAVTEMDVSIRGITSLKGIEFFTALTKLECYVNNLESLDVSENTALTELRCDRNSLQALDVSKNTALTKLNCFGNKLESLDVSKNTALTELDCSYNSLQLLNVSKNTALSELLCHQNSLQSLDVSLNTALTELRCHGNSLQSLDVSKNTALTDLDCSYNSLTSLNVSGATALMKLCCSDNSLQSLDLFSNTALTDLWCLRNSLQSLDVSNNTALTDLDCSDNSLQLLDVSQNTALTELGCDRNGLQSLDVSKNTALTVLNCNYNSLTSLNVSGATALTELGCHNNSLTSLNVSGATALETLVCSSNSLQSLDISGATALEELDCSTNSLTELDVSGATALMDLDCSTNSLSSLDVSGATALTKLVCSSNSLQSLDISGATALEVLDCSNNSLESLNVSKNTSLGELCCSQNKIRGTNMTNLVNSLPDCALSDDGFFGVCDRNNEGNVITLFQVKMVEKKGWNVMKHDDKWHYYAGLGDTNCDGDIDETDFDNIVKTVMGQKPDDVDERDCDMNSDQKVNAADIVEILNYLNSID